MAGGTADDDDFSAASGTLTWVAGNTAPQNITIDTASDDLIEPDETVTVTLLNPVGVTLGASSTATVTISDATEPPPPEPAPGELSFTVSSVSVDEGDDVEVTVSRTGGTDGAVITGFSMDPPTGEYTVEPPILTWEDGESTSMTVTITAVSDEIIDGTESFNLELAPVTTATNTGVTVGVDTVVVVIGDTTEPPEDLAAQLFSARVTDGEWEVCIPPFNTPGAFATQPSVNEGRVVSCVKACDDTVALDGVFPGWGFNEAGQHSCTTSTDAPGTYTAIPVYTPARTNINLNLDAAAFAVEDSIWGCAMEARESVESPYVTESSTTLWYQFFDDGTYQHGSSEDGTQPAELSGPDVWSADGRVLELGHINTGYRNTLFLDSQALQIYQTTDDRLNCTLQARTTAELVLP